MNVIADEFHTINVSCEQASSELANYHFTIYDTAGDTLLYTLSSEANYSFISDTIGICDTVQVTATLDCGAVLGQSAVLDTLIYAKCDDCSVNITHEPIPEGYSEVQFYANPVTNVFSSFTYAWQKNNEVFNIYEVENPIIPIDAGTYFGNNICLTLETDNNCTAQQCIFLDTDLENYCQKPLGLYASSDAPRELTLITLPGNVVANYDYQVFQDDSLIRSTTSEADSVTYTHLDWRHCATFEVSVQADCMNTVESGFIETVFGNTYCGEDGCLAAFDTNLNENSEYRFTSLSGALDDSIALYEWTIDGEWISEEDTLILGINDSIGQMVCLQISTFGGCSSEKCEWISDECAIPMDVSIITDSLSCQISYNGAYNAEEYSLSILDMDSTILSNQTVNSEYATLKVEGLEVCEWYQLLIETDCSSTYGESELIVPFLFNCEAGCATTFNYQGVDIGAYQVNSNAASISEITSYEWTLDGVVAATEDSLIINLDDELGQELCLNIQTLEGCSSTHCEWIQIQCPYAEVDTIYSTALGEISIEILEESVNAEYHISMFDMDGNEIHNEIFNDPIFNFSNNNITECTPYSFDLQVKCFDGTYSFLTHIEEFTTPCLLGYCVSSSLSGSEYIANVNMGAIDNFSLNDNGYGDYSSLILSEN